MTTYLGLILLTAFTLVHFGCSDGTHAPRPLFGNLGQGTVADGNIAASQMACIDVRDYEDLTADDIDNSVDEIVPPPVEETVVENEEPDASGYQHPSQGLIGGNVSNQNNVTPKVEMVVPYVPIVPIMPSIEVIQALNGIDPEEVEAESATAEIQDCIEDKIDQLEDCGTNCEFYWGAGQWLMTSQRFYKKPKDSEVNVVKFKNCDQVKSSECLLTN